MSPIVTAANLLSARQNNILTERNAANSSQVNQAERMVKRSKLHLPAGQPGDTCGLVDAKKCKTNRYKCYKSKLKCSSRCHSGFSCKNK